MKLDKLTDLQLVKLYQEGNNRAFEVLLLRYKSAVYSYILFLVRNRELAEDIFQDTFIKAIVTIQRGKYFESGKFLGWVNRIAHNLVIDYFRQEKQENTFSAENLLYELANSTKYQEESIETVILNEQVLRELVELIDFLPALQQEVVRMRYFQFLSFKEIAERTDVSINTALGRLRYALINLRRIAEKKNVSLELK